MRTTIAIADELLAAAKHHAQQRGQTLGSLVEDALRRELAAEQNSAPRTEIPVFTGGTGPRPGVDLRSNRAMYEALDENTDFESRR